MTKGKNPQAITNAICQLRYSNGADRDRRYRQSAIDEPLIQRANALQYADMRLVINGRLDGVYKRDSIIFEILKFRFSMYFLCKWVFGHLAM